MTGFGRKNFYLFFHNFYVPLWGTAAGNAMPDQGFDPATHMNATSSHAASTRDTEQDFQTSLPTLCHTRETTVGSLWQGADYGVPSFIPSPARY